MNTKPIKLIRLPEVREMTLRSTSRIYNDMKAETFPQPIKIGVRAVAWLESDIQAWIAERIGMRGAAA